jgi:putative transposase
MAVETTGRRAEVSARQRRVLESWLRAGSSIPPHRIQRARIVLLSSDRVDDVAHARTLGVDWQRVRRWRRRWDAAGERLAEAGSNTLDAEDGGALVELIREVLDNQQFARRSRPASTVRVTDRQRVILEKWVRNAASTPHRLLERCRIVLMSADGVTNAEQARRLGVDRQRVRRWRTNWAGWEARLADAEAGGASDRDLAKLLTQALSDAPRSGTPGKFTAEQLAQIISVACEPPEASGRPVTHWVPKELADEVQKRGIVESISPRHIDRFLKKGGFVRTKRSTG